MSASAQEIAGTLLHAERNLLTMLRNGLITPQEYEEQVNAARNDARNESGLPPLDVIKCVDSLSLKGGDVLFIQSSEPLSQCNMDRLTTLVNQHLEAVGIGRVLVILVEDQMEVRSLDEEAMRQHGWVRANKE